VAKSKIVLPRVAPYFTDEEAGVRVDRVLSQLTSDLQNLKAADTETVGGIPAASVGSSGIFFQTFENPVETTWTRRTDPTTLSYNANGQAGGKALNAVGEIFFEFPENIPFNADRLYRIRCQVRRTEIPTDPAKDLISVGVQGYAADGVTIVDTSAGTTATLAHWYCMADEDMGAQADDTWVTFTGYFQGWGAASTTPSTDADAPRLMSASVRYIRPCFRLNHSGGDGTQEIDYISLEVLTEATEGNQLMKDAVNLSTGKIATNKVVEGSITASAITTDKLDAQAVTAAKIETGTITATQITGSTLSAIYADIGTITAGLLRNGGSTFVIDLDATGTEKYIDSPAFWVKANGDADFSGDISSTSMTASALTIDGVVNVKAALGFVTTRLTGAGFIGRVEIIDSLNGGGIIRAAGTGLDLEGQAGAEIEIRSNQLGFYGTTAISKPTVTGSRGGNAALADLLTELANLGLITDSST